MIWLLSLSLSLAVDEADLVDALVAEQARAFEELSLPDSPGIYHLRHELALLDQVGAVAELGGLIHVDTSSYNGLGVEVRVGDPSWDNTGFGGWSDGFRFRSLAQVPTVHSVRLDTWRVTDEAYKDAVEQYSRKQAQAVRPPDHLGDYTLTGPVKHISTGPALGPEDAVVNLSTRLSAATLTTPALELAQVHVGHEAGGLWIVDTEGTRVRRPVAEVSIRAVVHTRDDEGRKLTDARLWTARTLSDLPPVERMEAEIEAMSAALVGRREAAAMKEEYVGPVLFEGQAAAELFRWTLLRQLEGTPPEIPFDTFLGDIGSRADGARLNRRVLPPGWTVADDPQADPSHPGAYTHDWEGTPAEAVSLVVDGIVADLLSTRIPRKGIDGSNGHARGRLGQRAVAKVSLTTLTAPKVLSDRKLHKVALRAAAAYGHDHVLLVRRLQHPAMQGLDDADYYGSEGLQLPAPVEVVKLSADGTEEVLKGAAFSGVQRWVLRDIQAAGRSTTMDYLSSLGGDDSMNGPVEGTPCRITAPSVLVGELELVPVPGDSKAVRELPAPRLTSRSR